MSPYDQLKAGRSLVGCFYREFCVRAFEEGASDDWQYEVFDLIGDPPLVDTFSLGQLAERHNVFVNNSPYEHPDPRVTAIWELVAAEYQQVLDALQKRWGKSDLFAALYVSPEAKGALYPLDADLRDQVFAMEPPINMGRAWAWLEDGAGL